MRCISQILTKNTELGLTKGRGWFLKFLRGSDDFIMQKVHYGFLYLRIKSVVRLPVVCASSLYIRTSADRLITLLLIFSSLVFIRTIQI
jgi:hypothetical protein